MSKAQEDVILSAAKNLAFLKIEILHFVQDDNLKQFSAADDFAMVAGFSVMKWIFLNLSVANRKFEGESHMQDRK